MVACGGLFQREIAEDAGDRQRQVRHDRPIGYRRESTLGSRNGLDRQKQVVVVRADRDDIVRVMRDRGRQRAALEAEPLDIANADIAGCAMPFDL